MERVVLTFTVGACLGSFANLVAWRSAHQIPDLMRRSRCVHCASTLHWYELIPLLGFFLGKGRCRHCGYRIPLHLPLLECAYGGLLVILVTPGMPASTALWTAFLIGFVHVTAETDRMSGRIPNGVVAVGFAFGLAHTFFVGNDEHWLRLGHALLAGFAIWCIRQLGWIAFGKPGMGAGDVKLAAALGMLLGSSVFPILYGALMLAGMVALAGLLSARLKPGSTLPFAPFTALSVVTWLLVR